MKAGFTARAVVTVGIVAFFTLGLFSARREQQPGSVQKTVPTRPEPADRTARVLERMTPAQREHARLHSEKNDIPGRPKMLDTGMSRTVFSDYGGAPEFLDSKQVFQRNACGADAIVTGFVTDAQSFPSEDGQILFTDYLFTITEVFRSPRALALSNGQSITITRLGGSMEVEGVRVSADVKAFPPLEREHTYLLFLELIPTYKTFHTRSADSSWLVEQGTVKPLVGIRVREGEEINRGIDFRTVTDWLRERPCRQGR